MGELSTSLVGKYGECEVVMEVEKGKKGKKGEGEGYGQMVEYLVQEEMTEGMFERQEGQKGTEYYGTVFALGKYEELHLSKEPISPEES